MDDTQRVSNKDDALQRARERWTALRALVDALPAGQPLVDGWSTKLHVAHIAAWEASTAALLRKQHRGDALGVSRELWEAEDVDAINGTIADRTRGRRWDEVAAESLVTHNDLMTLADSMTQEELDRPYSEYAPYDPPYNSTPVIAWVNSNTWDHYDEHIAWITAGLRGAD